MIWSAFIIGVLGSLHCLGMCGPIALALSVTPGKNRYIAIILYNIGRIITYGFFGLLFGSFGSLFIMAGLQQFLSITAGVSLLFLVMLSLVGNSNSITIEPLNKIMSSLKITLGYYLKKHFFSSFFIIGLLNGLLPCGLVYMAVIGAIATGSALSGSYYMMLFGLGTVPAMFLIGVFKIFIPILWRLKLLKILPVTISLVGVMLIVRGLNIGIPYLSPEISSENPDASHCCVKTKCP